jgi:hypothetical protein
MEPISAIAISLALGAAATAGAEVVNSVIRDAYSKVKELIRNRYPRVSIDLLEEAPESKRRRAVVEEDLARYGAGQDLELLAAAHTLADFIEQQASGAANAIGVEIKDVTAANVSLRDIVATGPGVIIKRGQFSGDINVSGIRSGGQGSDAKK